MRLRNGLELRRLTGVKIKQHEIGLSVYGFAGYIPDASRRALAGTRASRLQMEPGILIGAEPPWRIHSLPRIGLGSRFAGDPSGWHLAISEPF